MKYDAMLSPKRRALLDKMLGKAQGETNSQRVPRRPATACQIPLSFAQQRLWFLDQIEPGTAIYNMPVILHTWGRLDTAALAQSIAEVVRRHEILRTTFRIVDEQPVQVVAPAIAIDIPLHDLQALPDEERPAITYQHVIAEIARPFDLANGPLLRIALFQLGPEEYVIPLTMHHIISDGWSLNLLCQEILALYEAFRQGRPSPLPELDIQYADFSLWQRQWLQGAVLERQLSYWQQQLTDLPALEFPTDRPRPAVQSYRGRTLPFSLPPALTQGLQSLAQGEGVSAFMILLAAFQVLLGRYSRQSDFAVGTPVANRQRAELQGLIGFFINTLVMRADLHGDPTFRQLLQRVRKACLDGYAHQDLPFEQLVETLHPERDLSRSPLFQVMFVFQNTPSSILEVPGLKFGSFPIENETAKFDLLVSLSQSGEELAGSVEYSTDLFDEATIQRLIGNFHTLLEAALADPAQRIGDIPLLAANERRRLLITWNGTQAPLPDAAGLTALFEAQVARTPAATALIFENRPVTYRALNEGANRLAHYLHRLGVGPDTLVGLCLERSVEMIVGILGILKAGGAYVPLDPAYPPERLRFMLADLAAGHAKQPPILLTRQAEATALAGCPAQIVCLDGDGEALDRESSSNPVCAIAPENLAYVIYTSGSTGQPKGVAVSHRNLLHSTAARQHYYKAPVTAFLTLFSFAFDGSIPGIFWTLCEGGALVLPGPDAEKDLLQLRRLIADTQPSHLGCAPNLYALLLAELGECLAPLKAVLLGGEACPKELVERHKQSLPGTGLFNEYGPTEGSVWCSVYDCLAPTPGARIPIGRPIANAQIYLLDAHLQPIPIGAPGELYLGGTGVVRGYLHRPDLTADRFLPHPYAAAPGERLYRTGDLARYLPDGNLEFLGRVDRQVKIRGYRIETGEIEACLRRHPAVAECVVAAQDTPSGTGQLAAYLVPANGSAPPAEEIRSFLRTRLPDYMVPGAFIMLEQLPLTPNGKIDVRALLTPGERQGGSSTKGFIAPRTPHELLLARIWCDVLGLKAVSVEDNFFELGGDSLLIMRVVARANQAGLACTPRQFFEAQTIAELAQLAQTPAARAAQGIVSGTMPLTVCQGWFFAQEFHVPNRWNAANIFEVPNGIDRQKLKQAMAHVMNHHDALRARFSHDGKRWRQHIAPPAEFDMLPFDDVDLSGTPDEALTAAIEGAADDLQNRLDIANGPLFRIAHFDLGPARPGRLLFLLHHLVCDSSSMIVLDDFQTAYRQLEGSQAVQLPPKTTSIKDWTERLEQYANAGDVHAELAYWQALPWEQTAPLPVDFPSETGKNTYDSVQTVLTRFGPEETRALFQYLPRRLGIPVETALMTALVQAVARWSGAPGLVFDAVDMGRTLMPDTDLNLSRTVGWFSLHRRIVLKHTSDNPSNALAETATQLHAMPNQGRSFEVMLRCSTNPGVVDVLSRLPRPEVIFNFVHSGDILQANDAPAPAAAQASATGLYTPVLEFPGWGQALHDKRPYLLECLISVFGGRLTVKLIYSKNLYRRATIQKVAQDFAEALRAIITTSQAGIEGLPS
ncbi:MAG: amino acid adenylation domain-containing protein [Chloroflexota bacterium]